MICTGSPADSRPSQRFNSPRDAKNLPVVFWIHGGGWQAGDKSSVQIKPKVFVDKGFVFVSTNYRLLPSVDIETIFRDIAKSIHRVHDHIAEQGGDPKRLFVMGHSAGAQLAALAPLIDWTSQMAGFWQSRFDQLEDLLKRMDQ